MQINLDIFKSFPISVNLAITNRCNLACVICGREYYKKSFPYVYDLPFDTLKKIEWFDKISVLDLCSGINEPLLYPQFSEFMKHLSNFKCAVWITTNLMVADEQKIKAIVKNNVKRIQLSINAGKKDTYERIMKNAVWERLNSNLSCLMSAITASGRSDIDIFVNYVICKSNFSEIGDFLKFIRTFGITKVQFGHLKFGPGSSVDVSESMYLHKKEWNEIMPRFYEIAKDCGIAISPKLTLFNLETSNSNYEASFKQRPNKCLAPYRNLVMQMSWNNPKNFWLHICGSQVVVIEVSFDRLISSKGLLDVWSHPLFKNMRKTCNAFSSNPLCFACKHTDKREAFVNGRYFDIFFSREIIDYCMTSRRYINKTQGELVVMPIVRRVGE